jgi:hypothetical protein
MFILGNGKTRSNPSLPLKSSDLALKAHIPDSDPLTGTAEWAFPYIIVALYAFQIHWEGIRFAKSLSP